MMNLKLCLEIISPTNKTSLIQFNNILKNMKLMKYNLEKNISLDVSLLFNMKKKIMLIIELRLMV